MNTESRMTRVQVPGTLIKIELASGKTAELYVPPIATVDDLEEISEWIGLRYRRDTSAASETEAPE